MLWCRLCAIFIAATSVTTSALTPPGIALDPVRPVLIDGIEFSLSWTYSFASDTAYEEGLRLYTKVIWINHGEEVLLGANNISLFDEDGALVTSNSISDLKIDSRGNEHVTVIHSFSLDFEETAEDSATVWLVAGGLTLLAPIVVIIVAAATREVLYALYFGILTAAFVIEKYNLFTAWLRVLDKYLPESLGDVDHAFVILFTWFLSGLIATITKSGGAFGIAEVFRKFAKSKTSTQAIIFILGFVIFFDDYANSLILGNTMRIVSDEHWISREKLCFIVDATTAPVASIAPISSWIGFEVGLIQEQLPYAVIVGFIAIVLGYLPVGYDAYASGPGILLGFLASMIIILFIGVRVDHPKRKLDIFNICYYKIKSFFPEKEPSTDEEAEALEKPENFYVYDEEYDREYVDIFRPKFWKMSTWRKKSTPTTGVDGAAAVVAEADAAADQKSAARAVVEED